MDRKPAAKPPKTSRPPATPAVTRTQAVGVRASKARALAFKDTLPNHNSTATRSTSEERPRRRTAAAAASEAAAAQQRRADVTPGSWRARRGAVCGGPMPRVSPGAPAVCKLLSAGSVNPTTRVVAVAHRQPGPFYLQGIVVSPADSRAERDRSHQSDNQDRGSGSGHADAPLGKALTEDQWRRRQHDRGCGAKAIAAPDADG